ncbi:hypothetical protein V8C86DRAFT_1041498 [Haematococcus lacustris]
MAKMLTSILALLRHCCSTAETTAFDSIRDVDERQLPSRAGQRRHPNRVPHRLVRQLPVFTYAQSARADRRHAQKAGSDHATGAVAETHLPKPAGAGSAAAIAAAAHPPPPAQHAVTQTSLQPPATAGKLHPQAPSASHPTQAPASAPPFVPAMPLFALTPGWTTDCPPASPQPAGRAGALPWLLPSLKIVSPQNSQVHVDSGTTEYTPSLALTHSMHISPMRLCSPSQAGRLLRPGRQQEEQQEQPPSPTTPTAPGEAVAPAAAAAGSSSAGQRVPQGLVATPGASQGATSLMPGQPTPPDQSQLPTPCATATATAAGIAGSGLDVQLQPSAAHPRLPNHWATTHSAASVGLPGPTTACSSKQTYYPQHLPPSLNPTFSSAAHGTQPQLLPSFPAPQHRGPPALGLELQPAPEPLTPARPQRLLPSSAASSAASSPTPMCAICLMEYELACMLRQLPCGHAFHVTCIDQWLRKHRCCPLCMSDVVAAMTSGAAVPQAGRP